MALITHMLCIDIIAFWHLPDGSWIFQFCAHASKNDHHY